MKNHRGVSILQVSIGLILSAAFIVFVMKVLPKTLKIAGGSAGQNETRADMANLLRQILQTGRLASTCQKVTTSGPDSVALECKVDFSNPPTGTLSDVRFYWEAGSPFLKYQTKSGGTWNDTLSFGSKAVPISSFILCAGPEMGTVPTCAIKPTAMSANFGALQNVNQGKAPPVDYSNRFFRFQITSKIPGSDAPAYSLQSGFFVRNPIDGSGLTYQWGLGG